MHVCFIHVLHACVVQPCGSMHVLHSCASMHIGHACASIHIGHACVLHPCASCMCGSAMWFIHVFIHVIQPMLFNPFASSMLCINQLTHQCAIVSYRMLLCNIDFQ